MVCSEVDLPHGNCGKCRSGNPYRDHQPMHRVHEDDAGDSAVKPDHVEQAGDVQIDRNARERLRQPDPGSVAR